MSNQVSRRGFLSAATAAKAIPTIAQLRSASAVTSASPDRESVARVSDFNPDPVDSTAALQSALDSDASTVIVDKVSNCSASGPLLLRRWRRAGAVGTRQRQVVGGEPVELVFTRLGGDMATPLAIAYETSGSTRERYDYCGLGKVAVIAPGERSTRVTVRTFARRRESDPARHILVVSVAPGHRYMTDSRPASVEVAIVSSGLRAGEGMAQSTSTLRVRA